MAWGSEFPVVAGTTKLNHWAVLNQLVSGTVERGRALECTWPRSSFPWETGTITAATETTVSTGKTWCGGTDGGGTAYAVPWNCHLLPFYEVPTSWKLVIDDNDPVKVVVVSINSWTNTGVLTIDNIRDYVTSKRIPSLTSLVGKRFIIIRGDYGVWYDSRIMEWPNAYQFAKGTVRDYYDTATPPVQIQPTLTTIKDQNEDNARGGWTVNEFAGKEVLFYAEDGFLKRATISANTADTITFATQGSKPDIGTNYLVVPAGGIAEPNRSPSYPYAWYRGKLDSYATHEPSDELGSASLPAQYVKTPAASFGECIERNEAAYDHDVWTEVSIAPDDQDCGRKPDKPYTLNVWKTIRGLQVALESFSSGFVKSQSYDSTSAIPLLNPAMMFSLAGINSFTGSTGAVEGAVGDDGSSNNAIAISGVTLPSYPAQVWYAVARTDKRGDDYYNWGWGVMTAAGRLLADSGFAFTQTYDNGTDPVVLGDNGRGIVVSLGWTRYQPKTFKRLYDIDGVFIPDISVNPDTGEQTPIDPAAPEHWDDDGKDCYGVGRYVKRAKSTAYIQRKHEGQSFGTPQGAAWEIGDSFANGDVARYVGENANGGTVYEGIPTSDSLSPFLTGDEATADYYERFYVGQLASGNQTARDVQLGGTTSEGGTFWLRDESKDWFDLQWFGGTMRTEEGVADGGNTLTLSDSTKIDPDPSNPTVIEHCYWADTRWGEWSGGAFVGFTVEILIDDGATHSWDDPEAIIERRLITSGDGSTVTIAWDEALSATASGKKYRIREPYYLNRHKDRALVLIDPSGVRYDTTVTGNSEDVIFFEPVLDEYGAPITVDAQWSYFVTEPRTGTVWKRVSGEWVEATSGADAVRTGVTTAKNFHSDSSENLPDYQKRYGRYIVGDAITAKVYNELYAALNVLRATKVQVSWNCCAVDGVDENNGASSGGLDSGCGGAPDYCDGGGPCETAKAYAESHWTPVPSGGGAPFAQSNASFGLFGNPCDDTDGCHEYSISRLYAYGVVDKLCYRMLCDVAFYDYGGGPGGAAVTSGCVGGSEVLFNAYGDPVSYQLWRSFGGASAVSVTARAKLGSNTAPSGSYPNGTTCGHRDEGYLVVDQTAVANWDVSGGFVYVT